MHYPYFYPDPHNPLSAELEYAGERDGEDTNLLAPIEVTPEGIEVHYSVIPWEWIDAARAALRPKEGT